MTAAFISTEETVRAVVRAPPDGCSNADHRTMSDMCSRG
jgi:hypothetical protein